MHEAKPLLTIGGAAHANKSIAGTLLFRWNFRLETQKCLMHTGETTEPEEPFAYWLLLIMMLLTYGLSC